MDVKDCLKSFLASSDMITQAYLKDVDDAHWMKRPHSGCNHLNWQIGHLLAAQNQMIAGSLPGSMPALPEGFAAKYEKATAGSNNVADFATPEELKSLYQSQRTALLAAIDACPIDQMGQPAAEAIQAYCPTIYDAFSMQATHWLMHCGQWVVIRRELGLPMAI